MHSLVAPSVHSHHSKILSHVSRNSAKPSVTLDAVLEKPTEEGEDLIKSQQDSKSHVTIVTNTSSLARNPVSVVMSDATSKLEL